MRKNIQCLISQSIMLKGMVKKDGKKGDEA
jgi:hypothetical protein